MDTVMYTQYDPTNTLGIRSINDIRMYLVLNVQMVHVAL
jgi:hypothetical protein